MTKGYLSYCFNIVIGFLQSGFADTIFARKRHIRWNTWSVVHSWNRLFIEATCTSQVRCWTATSLNSNTWSDFHKCLESFKKKTMSNQNDISLQDIHTSNSSPFFEYKVHRCLWFKGCLGVLMFPTNLLIIRRISFVPSKLLMIICLIER